MADDKTQVLIELKLQVKELKKQMDDAKGQFADLQKAVKGSMDNKESKEMLDAIKKLTEATKATTQAFVDGERKKKKAAKDTTDELKKQKKEVGALAKGMKGAGRFLGGVGAGLGLGALKKKVTARGAGASIGRGISAGIGGAAQFFMSGMSSAYQQHLSYGQALGGLVGLGTPGQMKASRKAAGGAGGANLGYSVIETAQQAKGIGRATGNIGAVYKGQQFGRAYGMDVGEAGGYMGMVRQAGYGFGGTAKDPLTGGQKGVGSTGGRELKKIMEAGLMSGIEKARLPEFLQGVSNLTTQVGSRLSGDVNAGGIAQFQSMLGRSGKSGFQGARGAAVAAQLGSAIQRPGGGEAGQAMMLQALGFGKPGGETSYYDALKTQQKGLGDPASVQKMFDEVYSQLGQKGAGGTASVNQEANLALSEMTGLSLDQVETMGDLINSGLSQEELLKEIKEQTEKAEPVEKQALKEMKRGFGGTVAYLAGIQDRQVALGGKFAEQFQDMQKLQLAALEVMAEYLPKLVSILKDVYITLSTWFSKLLDGVLGKPGETSEALTEAFRKEYSKIDPEYGGTLKDRVQALKGQKAVLLKDVKTRFDAANKMEAGWKYSSAGEISSLRNMAGVSKAKAKQMGIETSFLERMQVAAGTGQFGRQSYQALVKAVPELGRVMYKSRYGGKQDEEQVRNVLSKLRRAKMEAEANQGKVTGGVDRASLDREVADVRARRIERERGSKGRKRLRGSTGPKNLPGT